MQFTCSICGIACTTFSHLCGHLSTAHSGQKINVTCGIENCRQTFKNGYSLKNHGYRKHRAKVLRGGSIRSNTEICDVSSETFKDDDISTPATNFMSDVLPHCHAYEENDDDFIPQHCHGANDDNKDAAVSTLPELHAVTSQAIASLFVKVRECNLLPNSATREIFNDFSLIFKSFIIELQKF